MSLPVMEKKKREVYSWDFARPRLRPRLRRLHCPDDTCPELPSRYFDSWSTSLVVSRAAGCKIHYIATPFSPSGPQRCHLPVKAPANLPFASNSIQPSARALAESLHRLLLTKYTSHGTCTAATEININITYVFVLTLSPEHVSVCPWPRADLTAVLLPLLPLLLQVATRCTYELYEDVTWLANATCAVQQMFRRRRSGSVPDGLPVSAYYTTM